MSVQSKVFTTRLWLKTTSAVRLVVAVRLKHITADPLKDVLPQNWSELGEQIGKQLMSSGYAHLESRGASVKAGVAKRGMDMDVDVRQLLTKLRRYESLLKDIKSLERERETNQETFKMAKRSKVTLSEEEKQQIKERGLQLKQNMTNLENERRDIRDEMVPILTNLPNEVHPDTPVGGYRDSRVVETQGQKREFSFPVKSHIELGDQLDLYDYRGSSSASVNGLCYMKDGVAMLEMALIQFALQTAISKGYRPIITPDIIRTEMVEGCGFKPRGPSSQVFHVTSNHHSGTNLCLAGTAELSLAGYLVSRNIPYEELPIRYVAFGRCYRAEAGGSTLSSKGLYRLHQFSKVELFGVTAQEQGAESENMLQDMLGLQKEILSSLGLHYRVLEMATQELGAPAYHKYDIEVWMPGRGEYGEVTSASNCTDYQSRRLSITYPNQDGRRDKKGLLENKYAHTVNATGCAVPRLIISLLENYQQEDGSITLPRVLRPFLPEQYWTIR